MGSYADEAFGPEPGSVVEVQDPIQRPAPIQRPGEGAAEWRRKLGPPATDRQMREWGLEPRPVPGQTPPAPKSYSDEAFGPAPDAAPAPQPQAAPQAGNKETWGAWAVNTIRGRSDPKYAGLPSIREALAKEAPGLVLDPATNEVMSQHTPQETAAQDAAGKIAMGSILTPSDKAREDIVRSQLGNRFLGFEKDQHGASVVVYRGKDGQPAKAYVNRPGLDMEDVTDAAAATLPYLGPGAIASGSAKAIGGGAIIRSLAQGSAASGTSMATDLAAQTVGSQQGVDVNRAAIAGGLATGANLAGEGVAALWRQFVTVPGLVTANGQLTPKGVAAAQAAGVSPADMTAEIAKQFAQEVARTGQPATAASTVNTRQFGIPTTRGQITKDPADLLQEKAMRYRVYGQDAQDKIRALDTAQAKAIEDAAIGGATAPNSVANKINPNRAAGGARPDQIGAELSAGVQEARDAARGQAETAWKQVGGMQASDTAKAELPNTISAKLGPLRVDDKLTPKAYAMAEDLDRFIAGTAPGAGPSVLKQAPVQDLGDMRKRLLAIYKGASDKTDIAASKAIYDGFNEWIDTAAVKALQSGDPASAAWMRQARDVTKEMQTIFGSTAVGGQTTPGRKIVQSLLDDGTTPETIVGKLFSTDPGSVPKAGTQEALNLIKQGLDKYLPPIRAKAVWDDVRLAAWQKIVQKSDGELHTPTLMAQRIDRFFQSQRTIANQLFTPAEQSLMRRFGFAMKDISFKDPNPSGSGTANAFYASNFGKAVNALLTNTNGPAMKILNTLMGWSGATNAIGSTMAQSAVNPTIRTLNPTVAPYIVGPASQAERVR